MSDATRAPLREEVDVVVVGAGFGGLYMAYKAREKGLSVQGFERGDDVGGTWYWNRYPGARCDIESMQYSYAFDPELEQEWDWSERYATQPEILSYIDHVAKRYDLRRHFAFETAVTGATFDEATSRWRVRTDKGDEVIARYIVLATGCLSTTNLPAIKGIESFKGPIYHTGAWPKEGVDFTGLRVGVIGTGSSAIQSIPLMAEQAKHLTVFQRTPNYSIPAHNRPWTEEERRDTKANYRQIRANAMTKPFAFDSFSTDAEATKSTPQEIRAAFQRAWDDGGLGYMNTFADLLLVPEANKMAADFVREKIEGLVDDPDLAKKLMPSHTVGCKRLCVDTNYYATFNRDNVTLVDLRETPIEEITAEGVRTAAGLVPCDAIVSATGFDAMTGTINRIDIKGRGGERLRDHWADGARAYLGLGVAGFPNLFMITGPGSPSVLTNMLVSIQHHVDWIANAVSYLDDRQIANIEPTTEAENAWVKEVQEIADTTLFPSCGSWYTGSNIEGKPKVFAAYVGFPPYAEKCADVEAKGYDGFRLTPRTQAAE
ncbi:MAG: NAD(P)-binding protein [Alphaproteobacteria bacterium]|nr:NAD(P)-binding protein [Alphaproteobacteria bacterium]